MYKSFRFSAQHSSLFQYAFNSCHFYLSEMVKISIPHYFNCMVLNKFYNLL